MTLREWMFRHRKRLVILFSLREPNGRAVDALTLAYHLGTPDVLDAQMVADGAAAFFVTTHGLDRNRWLVAL